MVVSLPDSPVREPLRGDYTEEPLVVEGISKRYKGGLWANRDISLAVRPGEILGLLGPNGAGKTTLVRQITTELMPTSGRIRVFGMDVVSEPTRVKAVMGIVPQEQTPYLFYSLYHLLRLFGKLRGLSPARARVRANELIAELDLEEHRDVRVELLSGGLRRRALVGIAALARPSLFVLDEPTTGLDPHSRRDVWALIRKYREEGATVLLTTHYMEEAETLCDRVGIIQDGSLFALDTVPNLRALHGYEFKVTYPAAEGGGELETIYGKDDVELVERVRAMGVSQFSVAPTNLEDVYLALTGDRGDLDGSTS